MALVQKVNQPYLDAVSRLTDLREFVNPETATAIDLAVDAMRKQMARLPKLKHLVGEVADLHCPGCDEILVRSYLPRDDDDWDISLKRHTHCEKCGQKFDWGNYRGAIALAKATVSNRLYHAKLSDGWFNTAFQYKEIADMTKRELEDAGITTADVFHTGENLWFVPWQATTKDEKLCALHIISLHIN